MSGIVERPVGERSKLDKALISEAYNMGEVTRNLLLIEYVGQLAKLNSYSPPASFTTFKTHLENTVGHGQYIRWFDTALPDKQASTDPAEILRKKIHRTMTAVRQIEVGKAYIAVVIAPALNEESYIGEFLTSVAMQKTTRPVAVIIADNGSTDQTALIAHSFGAHVVNEEKAGIGPARAKGLEFMSHHLRYDPSKTIVFQTDSDCTLHTPDMLQSVTNAYENDDNLMVSIGPIIFKVTVETGETIEISGKNYSDMFGSLRLPDLFDANNRDVRNYLLSSPYYYMPGPNTAYRASVFEIPGVTYPNDRSWESLPIAIALQRHFNSEIAIKKLPEQIVCASTRGLVDSTGVLTKERQEEIQQIGHVPPYRSPGSISPSETVGRFLAETDRKTYALEPDEEIAAFIGSTTSSKEIWIDPQKGRVEKVTHAGTGLSSLREEHVIILRTTPKE